MANLHIGAEARQRYLRVESEQLSAVISCSSFTSSFIEEKNRVRHWARTTCYITLPGCRTHTQNIVRHQEGTYRLPKRALHHEAHDSLTSSSLALPAISRSLSQPELLGHPYLHISPKSGDKLPLDIGTVSSAYPGSSPVISWLCATWVNFYLGQQCVSMCVVCVVCCVVLCCVVLCVVSCVFSPSAGPSSTGRPSRGTPPPQDLPRPASRRGSHKMTPDKPRRTFWVVHGRVPRPQFHEKTHQEGKKQRKWGGRRKKKSAKFWPSTLWAHFSGFGPPPFGSLSIRVVDTSWADVVFLHWSSTPPVRTRCLFVFSLGRRHLLCGRVAFGAPLFLGLGSRPLGLHLLLPNPIWAIPVGPHSLVFSGLSRTWPK